ncbi:hypothetical protein NDU88_006789 [Pleurodeles waltl]|uniref:Uncharacterized protein n=1 Tax=Pleurodeles waltl TaxID=8319 RepID=A0AAV7U0G6_PLEWA|nr:hypothetical protein NDU88_006789 [Pleurodeles waltl]
MTVRPGARQGAGRQHRGLGLERCLDCGITCLRSNDRGDPFWPLSVSSDTHYRFQHITVYSTLTGDNEHFFTSLEDASGWLEDSGLDGQKPAALKQQCACRGPRRRVRNALRLAPDLEQIIAECCQALNESSAIAAQAQKWRSHRHLMRRAPLLCGHPAMTDGRHYSLESWNMSTIGLVTG